MPAIADICDPLPPLAANRQPRKQPPARLSRQRLGDGGSLGEGGRTDELKIGVFGSVLNLLGAMSKGESL